jgi:glycosyltransferase AglD
VTLISLFIPCYNEEKIIGTNIPRIFTFLKTLPWKFEVFLVNDNSFDNTFEIAKGLKKKYNSLRILNYYKGPSRRENLAHSFKKSNGDIIVFMDMDLATDLSYLRNLIQEIIDGNDIATGSRHIEGAKSNRLISRRMISYAFKIFVQVYFNSKINDHECGFKAFNREKLFVLLNYLGYDTLFKRKMVWDTEMLLIAQKLNYQIKEVPIIWKEGVKSSLRFSTELSIIPYLLQLRRKIKKIN